MMLLRMSDTEHAYIHTCVYLYSYISLSYRCFAYNEAVVIFTTFSNAFSLLLESTRNNICVTVFPKTRLCKGFSQNKANRGETFNSPKATESGVAVEILLFRFSEYEIKIFLWVAFRIWRREPYDRQTRQRPAGNDIL